nr:hypothetical protein OFPIXXUK_OFPIXXUK_CDS_0006 [Microvirus sp.]CAI9750771.1 hypothetical protein CTTEOEDQ_CTTEOEDQ_CDS_0006 [Microvirus sp.]
MFSMFRNILSISIVFLCVLFAFSLCSCQGLANANGKDNIVLINKDGNSTIYECEGGNL